MASPSRIVLMVVVVAAAPWAAPAGAEQRIDAAPPNRYVSPEVTIAQGEKLSFRNGDVAGHDVTADTAGPDGKPLFSTPIIFRGEEAVVEGSQYLTTGTYAFHCSVHPQMKGTLRVSTEGKPIPRPATDAPTVADERSPRLGARILNRRAQTVARNGLNVRVSVDEAAVVRLVAQARPRAGGPIVTIARGTARLPAAGVRRATLALTTAGRRALARPRSLGVLVRARAVDAAGNRAVRLTGRTLQR